MASSNSVTGSRTSTTGSVTVAVVGNDIPGDIIVDADGAIWLCAYSRLGFDGEEDTAFTANLIKFTPHGGVDTRFSDDGKSFLPVTLSVEFDGAAAGVQTNGQYLATTVVFSQGSYHDALSRTNLNGTPDATFGINGTAILPFTWGEVPSFEVQEDGSILVGAADDAGHVFVSRLNANGSLDTDFGDNGVFRFSSPAGDYANGPVNAALESDGKVLVTGAAYSSETGSFLGALGRFNADGTADSSFGNNGSIVFQGSAVALAVLDDGKVLLAGNLEGGASLMRFNADGSLDTTFGGLDGLAPGFAGQGIEVSDLKVLADGKLLLSGQAGSRHTGFLLSLMQLNTDGSLDRTFGNPDDGYHHLEGSEGGDVLEGTATYADAFSGGGGDDLLDGGAGRDLLKGGEGADVFRYQSITDSYRALGGAFSDRVQDFDSRVDTLELYALGFTGLGNGHDGTLAIKTNLEGTRTYLKSFDADPNGPRFEVVFDGDLSKALNETNILFTQARPQGSEDADFLKGNVQAEVIEGFAGDDRLSGGLGNDVLVGGEGRDILVGGSGKDVLRFDRMTDSYRTATENHTDRILDYSRFDDRIDVSALGFTGFGTGYNGTLKAMTNENHTLTYLKSFESDGLGRRFEATLQGDHSGRNALDVIFAEADNGDSVHMIGVSTISEMV